MPPVGALWPAKKVGGGGSGEAGGGGIENAVDDLVEGSLAAGLVVPLASPSSRNETDLAALNGVGETRSFGSIRALSGDTLLPV